MEVLFLGTVFAKENEQEVINNSKKPVEFSANVFQKKLISGLKENGVDYTVVSAPGINSFPNGYKKMCFKGFSEEQNEYKYVNFNNIWGIRNFSRAKALKHAVKNFAKVKGEKIVLIYSVHTPLLSAAVYLKRKDPNIKICLIVPDLPQFMNLSKKQSLIYKIGKKFDVRKFNKLNKWVDSYMLLTEKMTEKIDVSDKPYVVVEGIVDEKNLIKENLNAENLKEKFIVYTGKLSEKFGVKNLIDAFCLIKDENNRLLLCGTGDVLVYAQEKAKADKRIVLLGQVSPEVAKDWQEKASVLVNPRPNNEVYTRYSFPSKTVEYLITKNPVVAYKLDGMKDIYENFLIVPKDESVNSLKDALVLASNLERYDNGFYEYAKTELNSKLIIKKLLSM